MKTEIYAMLIAFAVAAVCCPLLIPTLRRMKFGQSEREDGPASHLKKAGTPTMGGIAILIAITISVVILAVLGKAEVSVLLVTLGFGLVGFTDDYLKVVKKNTKGLSPLLKMAGQFIITTAFVVYMMKTQDNPTTIIIPFSKLGEEYITWDMGWLYVPFVFITMMATDNGVNFADGVDGLCSSVTCVVAAFFGYMASAMGVTEVSAVCGAVIGALMGFLVSNLHPAQVFMGDTGSLALGGFVAAVALYLKLPLFILIVGIIYVCELLSVIIQVGYFKLTHGKRVFRMAPIHHHFELGGWSETKVVGMFTMITVLASAIAILMFMR